MKFLQNLTEKLILHIFVRCYITTTTIYTRKIVALSLDFILHLCNEKLQNIYCITQGNMFEWFIIKNRVCLALTGKGGNACHSSQKLSSVSFSLLRKHCLSINNRTEVPNNMILKIKWIINEFRIWVFI